MKQADFGVEINAALVRTALKAGRHRWPLTAPFWAVALAALEHLVASARVPAAGADPPEHR